MVLKKRLSYGSRGFYLPPIPHIPNSAKRKRTARSNPFGAFDLLATIAGKLLTGCENLPVKLNGAPNCNESKLDIVKKEPLEEEALNALDQISTNLNPIKTLIGEPGNPTKTLIGESGTDINPTKTLIGESETDVKDVNKNLIVVAGTDLNPTKTLIGELGTKKENNNNGDNNEGFVRSNSSDSSSEMPLYSVGVQNPNPNLFLGNRVYRNDDDENSSSKSLKLRNNVKKSFIAKLRKVASARNNTNDGSNTKCYTRKRTQKTMFKRKTILYNEGLNKRTVFKPQACGNRVNISIKSFKIPELFIELPESATISSLKKSVMEAVTAVLEGGLNLGVTLRGEKVKDENKTLKQVGIYQNATGISDSLKFTLEPTEISAPHVSSQTDDIMTEPLDSIEATKTANHNLDMEPVPTTVPTTPAKSHVSDPVPLVHSPMEVSSAFPELALVPVKSEPLDLVSARKSKQMEMMGQRRIRRPFSVGEVEGLVSAVEQLGTGRWRDVKIRAFDDAKHRTYVDLKDKWKTLVHTASIAPQQRRGEPVPQNLLDRVLAAQAYWAHQHSKLHSKSAFNAEQGIAIEKNIIALESN